MRQWFSVLAAMVMLSAKVLHQVPPLKLFSCNKVSPLTNPILTSLSCAQIFQLETYQEH